MIAAISLMRRRPDLTLAQFGKHWLHPHGTMTAELPGVRRYVQHHPSDAAGTNEHAHALGIEGVPELWFDDYEARRIAYTSPRMAECNIDSEQFVGSVTRLVTEPRVSIAAPASKTPVRVLMFAEGRPDAGWEERAAATLSQLLGVTGYVRHRLLEQAPAPASKIPEFALRIAGMAEVTFEDEAALRAAGPLLDQRDGDSIPTAVYRVEEHAFV